ncbi:hypothetical protein BT93_A1164 [Corymbia citriodora subsp. variegata]|nr:hypothetical protein BT93_A1164 [Corymbia citriodora subsp. variegata]
MNAVPNIALELKSCLQIRHPYSPEASTQRYSDQDNPYLYAEQQAVTCLDSLVEGHLSFFLFSFGGGEHVSGEPESVFAYKRTRFPRMFVKVCTHRTKTKINPLFFCGLSVCFSPFEFVQWRRR